MNEKDQSAVAYGTGPKEVRETKGMPGGSKQFGKNKMPQEKTISMPRYKEHR